MLYKMCRSLFQGNFSEGLVSELRTCTFDYIIGTYSFHHLSDGEKHRLFFDLLPRLHGGGKLLIGDVAFRTREELEKCRADSGDDWDEEENYFVVDELRNAFPNLVFEQKSYCSGIISIQK